ncbi:GPR1/FUN34/YaaH family transporter [Streptomyces sp. NPDC059578]|uniref:GPR1/FUN34/YaaH family transporter n=1 Tax=Streptomyces sp. NPDC059578 TaxID=3346874 RepID=UPI0036D0469C
MNSQVSAGSSTSTLGHLALGLTLLAFGVGHTGVIDGVTAADAVTLATYVGGVTLFLAGLLALRDHDTFTGTAFAAFGALWFTWGIGAGGLVSHNAAGLFLLLFALVAVSLTAGAPSDPLLDRGTYGLTAVALLLLAVGQFAESGSLAEIGGWFAAVAGLVAWYAATAALAHWPTALPRRAAGRGVTATG